MDGAYLRFCGAPQNRKGIDRIAQLCREKLNADPFSGYLLFFVAGAEPRSGSFSSTDVKVPDYVELENEGLGMIGGGANPLHIIRWGQRASNHSSTEASVRQVDAAESEVPSTGPARSSALRLVSRSTAAYRFVVSMLACPSQ